MQRGEPVSLPTRPNPGPSLGLGVSRLNPVQKLQAVRGLGKQGGSTETAGGRCFPAIIPASLSFPVCSSPPTLRKQENRPDRSQPPSSDHAPVKGADFEGNLSRTTWAQLAYGKRRSARNCTARPGGGLLSMSSWGAWRIGVSVLQEEPSAGGFRWLTPPPPRSPQVLFPPLVRGAETQERGDLRSREASDMCQHIWGAHPKSPRGDLPKQFKLRY